MSARQQSAAKKAAHWALRRNIAMRRAKEAEKDGPDESIDKSLFLFSLDNPIRKLTASITQAPAFDYFILLCVLVNSTALAMDTNNKPGYAGSRQATILYSIDIVILAIFTAEMVLKIIAQGFILGHHTYLRDGWNILDFTVVILAYVGQFASADLTAIRTLRVLRSLRILQSNKMKVLVMTLLSSISPLLDVMLLTSFVFFIFGIIGMELFAGKLQQRCGLPDFTSAISQPYPGDPTRLLLTNVTYTVPPDQQHQMCSGPRLGNTAIWSTPATNFNSSGPISTSANATVSGQLTWGSGRTCPSDMYCIDYGNPNDGATSFDNMALTLLTVFQITTMEGWSDIMYQVQDAVNSWAWIYFILLIALGALFVVNLAIAVLYVHYLEAEEEVESDTQSQKDQRQQLWLQDVEQGTNTYSDLASNSRSRSLSSPLPSSSPLPPTPPPSSPLPDVVLMPSDQLQPTTPEPLRDSNNQMCDVRVQGLSSSAGSLPSKAQQQLQQYLDHINGHPAWQQLCTSCCMLQAKPWFENLGMAMVVLNTLLLALWWAHMPPAMMDVQRFGNYVFLAYFVFELVVKVVGLGPKQYAKNGMNLLDALVTILGVVDITVGLATPGEAQNALSAQSAIRSLRLLRILRLARHWEGLNGLVSIAASAVVQVGHLSAILLLLFFTFGLIGMQLFNYKLHSCPVQGAQHVCPPGESCPDHWDCYVRCTAEEVGTWLNITGSPYNGLAYCQAFPRGTTTTDLNTQFWAHVGPADVPVGNFDNIGWALLTVFTIFTTENWNEVLYDGMRAAGPAASLFFVAVIVVGQYMLLNLFLAVLLSKFADKYEEVDSVDDEDDAISSPMPTTQLELQQNTMGSINDTAATVAPSARLGKTSRNSGDIGTDLRDQTQQPETTEITTSLSVGTTTIEGPHQLQFSRSTLSVASFQMLEPHTSSGTHLARNLAGFLDKSRCATKVPEGYALGLLSPDNPLRDALLHTVRSIWFKRLVLVLVLASSVLLALDSPVVEDGSTLQRVLEIGDYVIVGAFAAEAVLKILTWGFLFNGRFSYLRSWWNILDFIIMLQGIALLLVVAFGPPGVQQMVAYKILRSLRALRPLKFAIKFAGTRLVLDALVRAVPSMAHAAVVCLMLYIIFAIMATNMLAGFMGKCVDSEGEMIQPWAVLPANESLTKAWCTSGPSVSTPAYLAANNLSLPEPYQLQAKWMVPINNFDNVLVSLVTLFQASTTEGWISTMFASVDVTGPDTQPARGTHPAIVLFFVVFMITMNFFMLNMFVGVAINKFHKMKRANEGRGFLLTDQQEQWLQLQRNLTNAAAELKHLPPANAFRRAIFNVVTHRHFDNIMTAIIVVNAMQMASYHAGMSDAWYAANLWANVGFTALYVLEAGAKLTALHPKMYFKDRWNVFDFAMVLLSVLSVVVDFVGSDAVLPALSQMRVLRAVRLLRLIPRVEGLKRLVQTLLYSLPALGNVGALMGLFFFIYAVLAMGLFGTVKEGQYLNRFANFSTFPLSLLTLFRMTTGENWNGIMQDLMVTSDCILVTQNVTGVDVVAGSYLDPSDPLLQQVPASAQENRCSVSPVLAVLLFTSFTVLCAMFVINLVIGVIIDNFEKTFEDESEQLSVSTSNFAHIWAEFDTKAKHYMPAAFLPALLQRLDPPLGVRGLPGGRLAVLRLLQEVDVGQPRIHVHISSKGTPRVHFLEVLHALVRRAVGTQLPKAAEEVAQEQLKSKLPPLREVAEYKRPPHGFETYTAKHFYAVLRIQAAARAWLASLRAKRQMEQLQLCKMPSR